MLGVAMELKYDMTLASWDTDLQYLQGIFFLYPKFITSNMCNINCIDMLGSYRYRVILSLTFTIPARFCVKSYLLIYTAHHFISFALPVVSATEIQ